MNFRIDNTLKTLLENKAIELNTTQTDIIKNGIYRMLDETNTDKQKTEMIVRNQERINRLLRRIDTSMLASVTDRSAGYSSNIG